MQCHDPNEYQFTRAQGVAFWYPPVVKPEDYPKDKTWLYIFFSLCIGVTLSGLFLL